MSALKDLLQSIEAEIQLARRDSKDRLAPVFDALSLYERAIEEERVAKYCLDHSIRMPALSDISLACAAEKLLQSVRRLPELLPATPNNDPQQNTQNDSEPEPEPAPQSPPLDEVAARFRDKFPELSSAAEHGKLLVFGAFSGRTKSLPGPLKDACEWIDTTGDGNRTVSNAVRRIRNGHVFSVIICDQAIAHQHAEPVVASARGQRIPIGYAGKGGNASLARALETLENMLGK